MTKLHRITIEMVCAEETPFGKIEGAISETLWYAEPKYLDVKWEEFEIVEGTEENPIIRASDPGFPPRPKHKGVA